MSSTATLSTSRRTPRLHPCWFALVLAGVAGFGLFGPLALSAGGGGAVTGLAAGGAPLALVVLGALICAAIGGAWGLAGTTVLAIVSAFLVIVAQRALPGEGAWGYWLTLGCSLAAAAVATGTISLMTDSLGGGRTGAAENDRSDRDSGALSFLQRVLPAATVPFLLLLGWEGLVVGFRSEEHTV